MANIAQTITGLFRDAPSILKMAREEAKEVGHNGTEVTVFRFEDGSSLERFGSKFTASSLPKIYTFGEPVEESVA